MTEKHADALLQKVDCIRIAVADLEAGLAFYRDKLGLELIWRTERGVGLRLPGDETKVVLHTEHSPPPRSTSKSNLPTRQRAYLSRQAGRSSSRPLTSRSGVVLSSGIRGKTSWSCSTRQRDCR